MFMNSETVEKFKVMANTCHMINIVQTLTVALSLLSFMYVRGLVPFVIGLGLYQYFKLKKVQNELEKELSEEILKWYEPTRS